VESSDLSIADPQVRRHESQLAVRQAQGGRYREPFRLCIALRSMKPEAQLKSR